MNAVVPLPTIENAKLPASYEAAKNALAECSRLDECQAWADKAEAMASYARQAKDESLRKMADRIQARAIRRCGELLKQIEPSKGGDASLFIARDGADPSVTRKLAAEQAGLSERQRKTALRVANVPEQDFNQSVESDNPPTVTKLAEMGKQSKPQPLVDLGGINPADYARATEAQGTLRRFAEFCRKNEPTRIAKAFKPHEIAQLRQYVSAVDAWLDRFVTNLPEQ